MSLMAHPVIPHFHNTPGVRMIEIGATEFMCIGAIAPFDHPHIFLDMAGGGEIVCPYCSTRYKYNDELAHDGAIPAECIVTPTATAHAK
jgi:uncharacterized Zn-finger protein